MIGACLPAHKFEMIFKVIVCVAFLITLTEQSAHEPSNTNQGGEKDVSTDHDHGPGDTVKTREFFKKLKRHAFRKEQKKTPDETLATQQDSKSESFSHTQSVTDIRSNNNSSTNQVSQNYRREQTVQHKNQAQKEGVTQRRSKKKRPPIVDNPGSPVEEPSQTDNSYKSNAKEISSRRNSSQMATSSTNSKAESMNSEQYSQPEPTSDETINRLPKSRYFQMPSSSNRRRQYSKPRKLGEPGQPVQPWEQETNKETDNSVNTSKEVDSQNSSSVADSKSGINNTQVPIELIQQSQPQRTEQSLSLSQQLESTNKPQVSKSRHTGTPGHPVRPMTQKTNEESKISSTNNTSKVTDNQKSTDNTESTPTITNIKDHKELNKQGQLQRYKQTAPSQSPESSEETQINKVSQIGVPGQPVRQPHHQELNTTSVANASETSSDSRLQEPEQHLESLITGNPNQLDTIEKKDYEQVESSDSIKEPSNMSNQPQSRQPGTPGEPVQQKIDKPLQTNFSGTKTYDTINNRTVSEIDSTTIKRENQQQASDQTNKSSQPQQSESFEHTRKVDEPPTLQPSEHPTQTNVDEETTSFDTAEINNYQTTSDDTVSDSTIETKTFKQPNQLYPYQVNQSQDNTQTNGAGNNYQSIKSNSLVHSHKPREMEDTTAGSSHSSKTHIDETTSRKRSSTIGSKTLTQSNEREESYQMNQVDESYESSELLHSESPRQLVPSHSAEQNQTDLQNADEIATMMSESTKQEDNNEDSNDTYLTSKTESKQAKQPEHEENTESSNQNVFSQPLKLDSTDQQPLQPDQQNWEEIKNTSDATLQTDNLQPSQQNWEEIKNTSDATSQTDNLQPNQQNWEEIKNIADTTSQTDETQISTSDVDSDIATESTYEKTNWSEEPDVTDQLSQLYQSDFHEQRPANQQNSDIPTTFENASETESKQITYQDTNDTTTEQSQTFDQQYSEEDTVSSENTYIVETNDEHTTELNSKSEFYQAPTGRTDITKSIEESEAPGQTDIDEPHETNTVTHTQLPEEWNQSNLYQSIPQEQPIVVSIIDDKPQTPSISPENPSEKNNNEIEIVTKSYNGEDSTPELKQQENPEKAQYGDQQQQKINEQEFLDKSTQSAKSYQSEKNSQENYKTDIKSKTNETESTAATETRNSNLAPMHNKQSKVPQQIGPDKPDDTYNKSAGNESGQSQTASPSTRNTAVSETKESRGQYDIQHTTSVFQQAIQTDLHLKTLIVNDGPQSGLCYCSCDNNNSPLFISVDPRTIPGFR